MLCVRWFTSLSRTDIGNFLSSLWTLSFYHAQVCICICCTEEEKKIKGTRLKRGNQILIPLHMRAMILERIDHRHQILIKCRERCRDAIWWSNFSQAVKRNVFSLQEAQTLWALGASHRSTMGCAPLAEAGKLLWWLKVFQFFFFCHANDAVACTPWDFLPLWGISK